MTETLSECPLCKKSGKQIFLEGDDYFLTREPFTIVECESCGFRYTNPRPTVESSGRYYQSDEYISHDSGGGGILPVIYGIARYFTVRSIFGVTPRLRFWRFWIPIKTVNFWTIARGKDSVAQVLNLLVRQEGSLNGILTLMSEAIF